MDPMLNMLLYTVMEAVLLVTALSLDAFTVSLAYGFGNIRIPISSVFVISTICSVTLGFSLLLGAAANGLIPREAAKWISFGILTALGFARLFDSTIKTLIRKKGALSKEVKWKFCGLNLILYIYADPEKADWDLSRSISPKEAFSIAFALSLDGLAAGFSAGLTAIPILPVVLLSLFITAAAVLIGSFTGKKLSIKKTTDLSWLSGGMLLLLALFKL